MEGTLKQYEVFKVEREDQIAVITLNSPNTLNAFTWNFSIELYNVLTEISEDSRIRVVVLKAEGKIFSAGAHMDTMKVANTTYKVKKYMNNLNKVIKRMFDLPQPIICAIDGAGAGGGGNIALSCDFVYASEKAKFANVFINLGILPDTGGLWNLCRAVGPMRAKEIAMRGLTIGAEEALKYGLVTKVVHSETLYDEVMSFAKELASKPMFTLSTIKRLCNKMPEMTHDSYCEIEEDLMSIMFFTKDHEEGVTAFLEKRKPNFQGEDNL